MFNFPNSCHTYPPPPLSKARLGAKLFKKNGGPIGGCALDKARLGLHFSFILPINRKRRCKKRRSDRGVRLGQGGPLGKGGGYPNEGKNCNQKGFNHSNLLASAQHTLKAHRRWLWSVICGLERERDSRKPTDTFIILWDYPVLKFHGLQTAKHGWQILPNHQNWRNKQCLTKRVE